MYSRDNAYSSEEGMDFASVFTRASTPDRAVAGRDPDRHMLEDDIVDPGMNAVRHDSALIENKNLNSIIAHIRDHGAARPQPKKSARAADREQQQRLKKLASKQKHGFRQQALSQPEQKPNGHPAVQSYTSFDEGQPVTQTDMENFTLREQGRWQPFLLSLAIAVTAVMGFNLYLLNDQAIDMRATLESYEAQIDELSATQQKSSDTLINVSEINKALTGLKHEVSELETGLASTRDEMTAARAVMDEVKGAIAKKTMGEAEGAITVKTTDEADGAIAVKTMDEAEGAMAVKSMGEATRAMAVKTTTEPLTGDSWVVNLASLSSEQKARAGAVALEESGIQADVIPIIVNATMLYRLSVKGFASRADAMQFAYRARLQYGFEGAWVWQNQAGRS